MLVDLETKLSGLNFSQKTNKTHSGQYHQLLVFWEKLRLNSFDLRLTDLYKSCLFSIKSEASICNPFIAKKTLKMILTFSIGCFASSKRVCLILVLSLLPHCVVLAYKFYLTMINFWDNFQRHFFQARFFLQDFMRN